MNILLVGNGPSALSKECGDIIDGFDGDIVRFNHYTTKGYEKFVGSRSDIWITCGIYRCEHDSHKERYYVTPSRVQKAKDVANKMRAVLFPQEYFRKTSELMDGVHPSSGSMATLYYIDKGYNVYLWGFNFLNDRDKHHYNDDGIDRGTFHQHMNEWLFFNRLFNNELIRFIGHDRERESIPIIRQPTPCGTDDNVSYMREPSQGGWYEWFGSLFSGKTVLDVGAGTGDGVRKMREAGCKDVLGIDIDSRLNGDVKCVDVKDIEDNSFDVVTCVDVIEHVVSDLEFFNNLKRIAREKVVITTPNYSRSMAQNHHHCREYTIPQFNNIFQPSEVWTASPDGYLNRRKLFDGTDYIPLDTEYRFDYDGEEWPCICGIFNL